MSGDTKIADIADIGRGRDGFGWAKTKMAHSKKARSVMERCRQAVVLTILLQDARK